MVGPFDIKGILHHLKGLFMQHSVFFRCSPPISVAVASPVVHGASGLFIGACVSWVLLRHKLT